MQVSFAHSQLIKVWFTNKELSIYIVARYVKDYKYAWPHSQQHFSWQICILSDK